MLKIQNFARFSLGRRPSNKVVLLQHCPPSFTQLLDSVAHSATTYIYIYIYVKLPKKTFIMSSARTLEQDKYDIRENRTHDT